eukprot:TRINITY_DN10652_c1_g1_i1.p1 TRINITY_DN10652_c1_g1~~TRINITY_DN10652_c1_g1_i1.p1  ORF type:complete len:201 (+),score=31.71 TRINITY_DN10652_c1_g1_i1:61-663(+)
MVAQFASEDNVVSIVPVRFKRHHVTEEAKQEMRALKMRARFSRSLSPERVCDDARLRAVELERKARRYNVERSPEVQLPHSVNYFLEEIKRRPSKKSAETLKSKVDEGPTTLTASDSHEETTAQKKERPFVPMKMRFSKLFSSRSGVSVDVGTKPSLLASIRSRFIAGRLRCRGRQESDGDPAMPRASSDHVEFDSICTR